MILGQKYIAYLGEVNESIIYAVFLYIDNVGNFYTDDLGNNYIFEP